MTRPARYGGSGYAGETPAGTDDSGYAGGAPAGSGYAGFTILELLVAMAIFALLGTAVVTLLGQGMTVFVSGTADTSMQDRLQSALPTFRDDLSNAFVPDSLGVPPVVVPDTPGGAGPSPAGGGAAPLARPSTVRFRSGWFKPTDFPPDRGIWAYYVAFVRTNAREAEDPMLREAGTAGASGVALSAYDPAAVDSGVTGNLLAAGGLMEVAYVAIPEDIDRPGILTLFRLFRAPVGGSKTLLDPANIDSLKEIREAGRPRIEGVLHFMIRFRNVFATSWDVVTKGRIQDGEPYAGEVWDSTRGEDKEFALYRDATSLGEPYDDVYPARARIALTLATPGAFGFGKGDTTLAATLGTEETRVRLVDPAFLLEPGPADRWIKVGTEWMLAFTEQRFEDLRQGTAVVARGKGRKSIPREHKADEPIYYGAAISTDVPMVFKDLYVRRR